MARVELPYGTVECKDCEGSGVIAIAWDDEHQTCEYAECETCGGSGVVEAPTEAQRG